MGTRFWISGYLALLLGFIIPGEWIPQVLMGDMVAFLLSGILFFSGLRLPLTEIIGSVRDLSIFRQQLFILPVKLVLIPLLAYGLCSLLLPTWAAGVFLVTLMPMGLSSIAFCDLYGGHRMMAVFLVLCTSLLAPLTVPLMLAALGFAGDGGFPLWPILERTGYILLLLLVPLGSSQIVRRFAPNVVQRNYHLWNPCAILSSSLMVFAAVTASRPWWEELSALDFVFATMAACLGSALSFVVALLPMRFLPADRALGVLVGCLYMNNGLAVAFALQFFPGDPNFILPGVFMQIPMIAATALAGKWWGKRNSLPAIAPST